MTLTAKQQNFVDAFLAGETTARAIVRAGYSPKRATAQARTLLNSPKVVAALKASRGLSAPEIDQKWIVQRLVQNVERAMGDGKAGGKGGYQGAVANRALELLGKHYGLFNERVDIHYHHEEALKALV